MNSDEPCAVILCKCCSRIIYASCFNPLTAEDKKNIGDAASGGHAVKTITTGQARKADWGCSARAERELKASGQTGTLL